MNDQTQNLSHDAVSKALETLFVGEDAAEAFSKVPAWQVHRHLADCEACQRHYDGLALTDRLLSDDSDRAAANRETSGFERSFGEASFLGALAQMLEQEEDARREEAPEQQEEQEQQEAEFIELGNVQNGPWSSLRYFSAAAAVLLVGAASWFAFNQSNNGVVPVPGDSADSQFQARTAASPDAHGPFEVPDIEIFCAERTPDGVHFTGTKDAPFGLLDCPQDAEIKLAYHNRESALGYAAFFGVGQDGRIYWYGPTPADKGAIEVEQSSELVPFGQTIRLAVNHQPGPVRVFGLFSAEPLDFVELRRVVDNFDREELFAGEVPDQMAVRGVLTSSTFEVSDGGKR